MCTKCPAQSSCPPMSRLVTDCACNAGWYGPNGGLCLLCPANSWCPGGSILNNCSSTTRSASGSSDASACKVNNFIFQRARQSSNLPGAENNLSFSIATNNDFDIKDGLMNVTVQGIRCAGGCRPCGNSTFKIVCTSPLCALSLIIFREGAWTIDPTTKKPTGAGLYLNITQKIIGGQLYNFSFCVINPIQGQDSPVLSIMATRKNIYAQTVLVDAALGREAPLSVLGFAFAQISQNNPMPGAINMISVTFSLYSVLSLESSIVLTGLSGSNTSTQVLEIQSSLTAIATTAAWNGDSANLTLTTILDLNPATNYSFSFNLNNSGIAQTSPLVSVYGWEMQKTGQLTPLKPIVMSTLDDTRAVLVIAGFPVRTIGQSSTVPSGLNLLMVALQSTVKLFAGSSLTISGLLNSGTTSGNQLLLDSANSGIFDSRATWDQGSGSLTIFLTGLMPSMRNFTFSFALVNPAFGQASPDIFLNISWVSGSGSNLLYQRMDHGDSPPFFVAGIRTKSVGQTNAAPSCNNTIRVTLNFFVQLQYDPVAKRSPTIDIWGLTGSVVTIQDKIKASELGQVVELNHAFMGRKRRLAVSDREERGDFIRRHKLRIRAWSLQWPYWTAGTTSIYFRKRAWMEQHINCHCCAHGSRPRRQRGTFDSRVQISHSASVLLYRFCK